MNEQRYTSKQLYAIAEFCGYATALNSEGDRIHPNDLVISERPHNGSPNEDRLDLTVVALTPDIVVQGFIDCYGNGARTWGYVDWVHTGADECDCDECKETDDD